MIVPISQAGQHLNPPVTRQALSGWIKAGCDAQTPEGLIDTEKAQAWRERYRQDPDTPGAKGGRRKGAGRPKGSKTAVITTSTANTSTSSDATFAEIKRGQEALKLAAMHRAEQLAAGELVKADDTERAVRAACMEVRNRLEQIPARASRRLVDEFGLDAGRILGIRRLLAEEVDNACRSLAGLTHDDVPTQPRYGDRRAADAGGA